MKTALKQEILLYCTTFLTTALVLFWLVYQPGFSLQTPFEYFGDAILTGALIKTVIQTGWYVTTPLLGAPFSYNLFDYPLDEGTNILLIKLLSCFTKHYAVILNVFFLLSFILVALTSLYAFRRLGLKPLYALATSILFTFIPYHMMRGERHLFLSAYYTVPIYILFVFALFNSHTAGEDKKYSFIRYFSYFVVLILAASSGIYYAFFACFFLFISGILASLEFKNKRPFFQAILIIAVISVAAGVNLLPSILYHQKVGPNLEVANRHPLESELYGLKIIQLLIPTNSHRLPKIAHLREKYLNTAPLVNENTFAALGTIASLGFLALLGILFLRNKAKLDPTLFYLSRLNLAAVLFGTIGGFGAVFAYTISPMIRCFNRISIFIAFFSLAAFFLLLQKMLQSKWIARYRGAEASLVIALILIGIPDQIGFPHHSPGFNPQFKSDQQFVQEIERILPPESLVFQLPVSPFPETPPIYRMPDYSHFRGFLHSNTLHWSYGLMRGRNTYAWGEKVAAKPVKEMIDDMVYAGFRGIYINKDGYMDGAKALEQKINTVLKQSPLVSPDKTLIFYNLQPYAEHLKHTVGKHNWNQQLLQVQQLKDNLTSLSVVWGSGMFPLESHNNDSWHWSENHSALTIYVSQSHPVTVKLSCVIKTASPEPAKLWIKGGGLNITTTIHPQGTRITREWVLTPGKHRLYFSTDAKPISPHQDPRPLSFAIHHFNLALKTTALS